jgi:hypothetical protein
MTPKHVCSNMQAYDILHFIEQHRSNNAMLQVFAKSIVANSFHGMRSFLFIHECTHASHNSERVMLEKQNNTRPLEVHLTRTAIYERLLPGGFSESCAFLPPFRTFACAPRKLNIGEINAGNYRDIFHPSFLLRPGISQCQNL